MAFYHGVKVSEVPTSILPPVDVAAGIPFIVGTAPQGKVNEPVLCATYADLVAEFGFVPAELDAESGLKKYAFSISEFAKSQFGLFGVGPVIVVNVLDTTKHKKVATTKSIKLDAKTGSVTVAETGILLDSVSVVPATSSAYTKGVDYEMALDDNAHLVITSLKDAQGQFKCAVGEALTFVAEKADASKVTIDEVVGGVNAQGKKSGFELVDECFPRFRLVPGILLAPGYSGNATVAAIMAAKSANINELFSCVCLIDVPTDEVKLYSDVPAWKNENNIVDSLQYACWPMLKLDDTLYHASTQVAGLIGKVDGENDDVPYKSPSNENVQATATVLADGTEVFMDKVKADYLNSQGIATFMNFMNGWVLWGNRTACFPGNTDVKDNFLCIRRMFNWVGNTLIQTFWQKVDDPTNLRLVQTVVESCNVMLNGWAARQYILGGRVVMLDSENPKTDLMNGKIRFHVYITPPSAAEQLEFILEYDPAYVETLFG